MSWNVRLSVRAKSEFMDAVTYFDSVSNSISDKFIKQLFDSLDIIERNPLAYRKVKGNFRQFVLQELPFLIVFCRTSNEGRGDHSWYFLHRPQSTKEIY
ncbi:MAG: hypothetical protein IPK62_09885 [Bacteroidetes bacterium]|nr:hypothetical protein [Bacteroidota bacterium]